MKICLISFDHWEYDRYITETLKAKDIDAHHINFGAYKYKYPNPLHRVGNFVSKLVLKKNIKKIKQRQFILDELKKLGPQDKILVINPESIPVDIHKQIKPYAKEYIAYLYDSSKRCPIDHLLNGLFDKIFSFDEDDVAKYKFIPISNYIYLPKKAIRPKEQFKHRVFIIITVDKRLKVLNALAEEFDKIGVTYNFVAVGPHKPADMHPGITYLQKIIKHDGMEQLFDEAEMFLDIIRDQQTGLSFRVFESLAYQKKLITTNPTVKNYEFYDPNNVMVIDPDNIVIDPAFFETPYEPLPEDVYHKFTLDHWVDVVFDLK